MPIVGRQPWAKQPASPVGVDASNSINAGIAAAVLGHTAYNVVSRRLATTSTNKPTPSAGQFGIARTFVRGTSAKDAHTVTGQTGDATILFVGCLTGALGSTQKCVGVSTGSTKRFWIGENGTSRHVFTVQPSGGAAVSVAEATNTTNIDAVWVGRITGTTIEFFRNGVSYGTNTIASQNFSDAVEFDVGWTGFLENPNARVYLAAYWKRSLTDNEVQALSRSPYQIFAPLRPLLPAFSGGAGGTTVTCTAGNATVAGTAALVNRTIQTAAGDGAASGVTALLNAAIPTTAGNAAAAGVSALLNISIVTATGNVTAAGVSASVSTSSGTTVTCAVGDAAAAGTGALLNITVAASPGDAAAAGISALVGVAVTVTAVVGDATAAGVSAVLPRTIVASIGAATAAGVTAVLLGYTPPVSKKGLRKTEYVPTGNVPRELEPLVRFVQQEFVRVAGGFESPFTHQLLRKLNVEPERKLTDTALIVYADGANFDPTGAGEGIYSYYGGAWHKLG